MYSFIKHFIFTFLMGSAVHASAQKLSVSNSSVIYNNESRESISVQIVEPSPKQVKAAYKDWIEDNYDAKIDGFGFLKNKDLLVAEKANISSISSHKMDLYAKIIAKGSVTEMNIFGSLGYDYHISRDTYPQEFSKMRSMVYAFLEDYLPGYYQEKVEESSDLIEEINDDKSNARDDIKKNRKEIESLKKENADLVNEIKNYEQKLKSAEESLKVSKKDAQEVKKIIKEKQ